MRSRQDSYTRGWLAEYLAAGYLWVKGFQILTIRYKTPLGEVDIIARRGEQLIFAEVKYRPDLDEALYAVTPQAQNRIMRAAQLFMAEQKNMSLSARFDIIAISPPFFIRHIENAWQPRS
ncbi:MAG: YraN family protein [Alphaproteobacteria bacterium]|nr:YraN family protein [Alphaproteobacteria bacterium]